MLVEENKIKGKDPKVCTFFCSGSVFVGVFTKHRTLKCKLFWNACTFCHFRKQCKSVQLYTVRHLNFKITGVGIKFVIP